MVKANFEKVIDAKTGDVCEAKGCGGDIIRKVEFHIIGKGTTTRAYCNKCNKDYNVEKYS